MSLHPWKRKGAGRGRWLGLNLFLASALACGAAPPVAEDDVLVMEHYHQARVRVLANDNSAVDQASLRVVANPRFGLAAASPDGTIVYKHTSGSPELDRFSYRVNGSEAGLFAEAEVTINFSSGPRFETASATFPATPPTSLFALEDAFPGLTFNFPHDFAIIPGTRGLLVTEADGTVQLIADTTAPVKTLFLDITDRVHNNRGEQAMKGIAVHPSWPAEPYIYVTYNTDPADGIDSGSRLSRFTTTTTQPLTADPASELILIDQDMDNDESNNHTINTPAFGADGYLYVGFGDEDVDQRDGQNNSQHLDRNLWSCVIRIDVDCRPENLDPNPDPPWVDPESVPPWSLEASQTNDGDLHVPRVNGGTRGRAYYKIPIDNPFVHTSLGGPWDGIFNGRSVHDRDGTRRPLMRSEVRTEIYALGLRNPWQISPEDDDGDGVVDYVALGDVGREWREEVNFLEKGDNGQWAWFEGEREFRAAGALNGSWKEFITNPKPPVWKYRHGGDAYRGDAAVGGLVYRKTRYPSLAGTYLWADYDSGNIWSLDRDRSPLVRRLGGGVRITAIGLDPATDEILFLERAHGRIRKLVTAGDLPSFPATLSATNFFADLGDFTPNPGGRAYGVNLAFWSDGAEKRRWFLVGDPSAKFGFAETGSWTCPPGTIFAKHFDIELRRGDPASKRRLETRFLVLNGEQTYGVTYRWNHITDGEPQTEATLVGADGDDLDLTVDDDNDPGTAAIEQIWHFPTRTECLQCHNAAAGWSLSFNTRQLNRAGELAGREGNYLDLLAESGYLDRPSVPAKHLPRQVRPDEAGYSLEARFRSWLDVNCAICHGGDGALAPPSWDGRLHSTLEQTGLINGTSLSGALNPGERLIVPGQAERSILKHRVARTGGYSGMPPLGSNAIDEVAVNLVTEFINKEATGLVNYRYWRRYHFGSLRSPEGEPDRDPDGDGRSNAWEQITNSDPMDPHDYWRTKLTVDEGEVTIRWQGLGNRRVRLWRSDNLLDWYRWDIEDNDGIPRNPAMIHRYRGRLLEPQGFFRFEVREN